jgi:hypothetical protein
MTGFRSISNPAASQVLRPKFRVRVTILLAMSCIFLLTLAVLWHGYQRGYAGFGVVGTIVLIWEYCKERSLIRDSQVASAVITESRIRWRGAPHLCEGAPRIKYFFSASDYKIYTGEAGSNIRVHPGRNADTSSLSESRPQDKSSTAKFFILFRESVSKPKR